MSDSKPKGFLAKIIKPKKHSQNSEFDKFLDFMNLSEEKRREIMLKERDANYAIWSKRFYLLKSAFNTLWDFFQKIEEETEGWYCISPTLSPWRSVGHSNKEGYTFSACIMKNKNRRAPLSEKSLTVSYGLEQWGGGIGDEIGLGRVDTISDNLVGLEACQPESLAEQYHASKRLIARMDHKLLFRMNHKEIGQETARLGIDILKEHSLVELSENLFKLLNRDMIVEMSKELGGLDQKLIGEDKK